jgi:Protein of unknown function (DUF2939)
MTKKIVGCALLALLVLAASSYFSPYYTIHAMKKALDERDTQAFSQYVDFPALREDINQQLQARVRNELSTPSTRNNPLASLGAAIVSNLAKPKLDAEISAAGLMMMLRRGELRSATDAAPDANASAEAPGYTSNSKPAAASTGLSGNLEADRQAHYSIRYTDASTVVATSETRHITFTFRRHGIWSWRLVGARLPAKNLN